LQAQLEQNPRSKTYQETFVEPLRLIIKDLFSTGAFRPKKLEWQRRAIWLFSELEQLNDSMGENGSPGLEIGPGLHLVGFKSSIDDSERHYRVFIPKA